MADLFFLQRRRVAAPRDRRAWLRRAVLLCSIAAVLVLVGDHSLAGALGPGSVQTPPSTSFARPNLVVLTSVAVSVHQSIGSAPARTFEVLSLIVLGLSLLVGGRALTRVQLPRQSSHDTVSHAAGPIEVAIVTRHAQEPSRARLPQSGAR